MVAKWKSRRWIIALWAMMSASSIVVYGMVAGDIPGGMGTALPLLIGLVGAYMASNTMTRPKEP